LIKKEEIQKELFKEQNYNEIKQKQLENAMQRKE